MKNSRFTFTDSNSDLINAYSWQPEKPVAALQIVHGMMEHSARYEAFASYLAGKGIAVYMNDHRGHGKNLQYIPGQEVQGKEIYGHFTDHDGWAKSVETLHFLTGIIKKNHPGIPLFILGHSMGSVLARSYLNKYSREIDGAILSGTILQPPLMLHAGILLVDILRLLHGPRYRSKLLISLGYGSYSKYFKPKRTDFDWLTSDTAIVDEYVADPLCGFPCTTAFYSDFFSGIRDSDRRKNLANVRTNLPLLIFSGKYDPTGHFGKDPEKIAGTYRKMGLKDPHLLCDDIRVTELQPFFPSANRLG